ncbi:IS66 family insertion sequence element accessory protein TnpA [Paenibacillus germinis]|uniref:IS66 family insertion sequence element accessory protein TnpA n=1 Tax=Paenibacillus germinis TaxID=2654979 RepID=UPI0014910D6A|nr:helix-turn-helix domain-containing protein [Paenibacillus germinis]
MARENVQKKWEAHIATFRSNGEKATKWCTANQVNRRQLYNWMKRLSGSSAASTVAKSTTFLSVEIAPEAEPEEPASLRIRLGAAVIEVEAGFNPALLRDVVRALQTVC